MVSLRMLAVFLSAALLWPATAKSDSADSADPADAEAQLKGDCGSLPKPTDWTPQETWAWDQICKGEVADLSDYATGPTNPASDEDWPKERQLSAKFLNTILMLEPYRSAVPVKGVHIRYAVFSDAVDLTNASIVRELQLNYSRFLRGVILDRLESSGPLILQGSYLAGGLTLEGARLGGNLVLADSVIRPAEDSLQSDSPTTADLDDVSIRGYLKASNVNIGGKLGLYGAQVTASVELSDARVGGRIDGVNIQVGGDLWLDNAKVSDSVTLTSSRVLGDAALTGAQVSGELDLSRQKIAGDLFLEKSEISGDLTLQGAQISGNAQFSSAHVEGEFNAVNLQVGRDLWLDGAQITKDLRLDGAQVSGDMYLSLEDSTSVYSGAIQATYLQVKGSLKLKNVDAADIDFRGAQVGANMSFTGSHIHGSSMLERLHIGQDLFMDTTDRARRTKFDGEVDLRGASVDGNAFLTGLRAFKDVQMDNLTVAGDLEIGGAFDGDRPIVGGSFAGVSLLGAHIDGEVRVRRADFNHVVLMNDVELRRNLRIGDQTVFHDGLELNRARITGEVSIVESIFFKRARALAEEMPVVVQLGGIRVGDSVELGDNAQFVGLVSLTFSSISRNLDLTGGEFMAVDLTGTTVGSELRLGTPMHPSPTWQPPQVLTLRNVSAGALQDLPGAAAWPGTLDLEGFTYSRLGGNLTTSGELAERPTSDLIDWLDKQHRRPPQSYIQLAGVLRAAGFSQKADWVLFVEKYREIGDAPWYRQVWLCLEMAITGFGIYPILALGWVVALVAVGAGIFGTDKKEELRSYSWPDRIIYSMDMLLPVVHLRKVNYEFEPSSNFARHYLYFHRLAGFLLASVVIASLTNGTVELHG